MTQLGTYLDQIISLCISYAPKLLMAIILLLLGWWLINRITKGTLKVFEQTKINSPELKTFFGSMVEIGLKILLMISIAGIVGIETTSFVGVIAAMGFAVGLALQGNLSNFAAGVLILIFRPFKVGDEVKIKGNWSFVKEIQMFHTVLKKFDQTEVIIPNSAIINDGIHNLSATSTRSISILVRVPFHEDLDRVLKIVKDAAYTIPEIDKSGEPFFWISDMETHFTPVYANFKTTQEDFWNTDYKVRRAVINALGEHNVKVAYPTGIGLGEFGSAK
jgi:small conductance mechanosensitive channel